MARADERGPLSWLARTAIAVVVGAWGVSVVVSVTRHDGQPAGDCTAGAAVGLLGLVMLAKDWWPGKRMTLSLVEKALSEVEAVGESYLDSDVACQALAAAEVIARLQGRPGYTNAYTEKVDKWVATHQIAPSPELVSRVDAVFARVLGSDSELAELWDETPDAARWRASVAGLRSRATGRSETP